MQSSCAVLYCRMWSGDSAIFCFAHYLKNGTILRGEGKSFWTRNAISFPLQSLLEPFLILRRNELDMIINLYRSLCKVLSLTSNFNENWIFSADFQNTHLMSNFMKIRPVRAELFHADGQTSVAFQSFAKTPKNRYCGADKSLARPGRKQANVSIRMA